jgi:thiol-disulfide isomerase/thioredoxin
VSAQPPGPASQPAAVSGQAAALNSQRAGGTGPSAGPPSGLRRMRGLSRATRIIGASAALAVIVVAVISLAGNGAGSGPRPLPAARNFSLPAVGHPGQRVSLAAFAGRPVIINFFASWCAPCKRETPTLARLYRQSRGHITIIGVDSNDQAGPAMRFVRSAGVRYPVGADPLPAATTTGYGVVALPQTFFLDARHRIVKRIFGAVTAKELSEGVALMNSRTGAPSASTAGGSGTGGG